MFFKCKKLLTDIVDKHKQPRTPVVALIVEGEVLVQEIAEDAAKEVVAERADPVATAKDVVEHKHDSRAKQRVDHSYNEKGHKRLIEHSLLHSPWCTSQNTTSARSA